MPSSPNQLSPGQQFELRVDASDLEFDAHLAAQTIPENQKDLPGYLHLYYEHPFMVNDDDRDIEGRSFKVMHRQALQMKVSRHTLNKFSLSPNVEKVEIESLLPEWRIKVELQLGLEAAKTILIPPFFSAEERQSGVIPMYYTIPNVLNFDKADSAHSSDAAFVRLQEYLDKKPRNVVDGLMLVSTAARAKSFRTRNRANAIVLPSEPAPEAQAKIRYSQEVIELGSVDDYEYNDSIESAS